LTAGSYLLQPAAGTKLTWQPADWSQLDRTGESRLHVPDSGSSVRRFPGPIADHLPEV